MSAHDHAHGRVDHNRAFVLGVLLNLGFVAAETIYGLRAHSLALVADAGHNLSDVLGLALAWGATLLSARRPTTRHTYGLRGSSILAALANAVLLLIAIGAIAWEAVGRFQDPAPVQGAVVMGVAAIGIAINGATALLFWSGRRRDLNIRGAFLHMAADAGVSAGVVLAGLAITLTGWLWLDPTVSLVIVAVIAFGTWGLLRESVNLAMDAVPSGIDPAAVHDYLASVPGILAVHDVHIWAMSTTEVALTGHVVKPEVGNDDALLTEVCHQLEHRFGIHHATLQVERDASHFCSLVNQHESGVPVKRDQD